MKLKIFIISFSISVCAINKSYSNNDRIDAHAPIGVKRDHTHKKGEIMGSYRTSYADMKGLISGNNNVTTKDVLKKYKMSPTRMIMKMHMLGIMYGITDKFTISAMSGFIEKKTDLVNVMNVKSQRETAGISDSKINLSYGFLEKKYGKSQLNLALSLPTGNINKKYKDTSLAYPMQIGSGSYELRPGISYSAYKNNFSYGSQINGIIRLNTNDNRYKLGNSYNLTSWVARKLNNSFSISTRIDYNKNKTIKGADPKLKPKMMPGADNSIHDREKLELLFGINFINNHDFLKGNRLAIELGKPIYQKVDGPLLKNNFKVTIGWQNKF